MNPASPVVVKLGGSLAASSQLPILLRAVGRAAADGLPVVIVPGGGPFADAVRAAQRGCPFEDVAAHDMALLAMAQYGRLLGALAPDSTQLCWGATELVSALAARHRRALIWLPQPHSDALEVERSWRIGADALALWLADRIGARRVILVKSCAAPMDQSLAALAAAGVIDTAYPEMAARLPKIATTPIYAASATALEDELRGSPAAGLGHELGADRTARSRS
jgi:5-(aminomethyl)-3-furanmethanol phosphate kinase